MTLKTLVTGVAAAAVVGGAAAGVTSIASGPCGCRTRSPVFDTDAPASQLTASWITTAWPPPASASATARADLVEGGVGIIEGKTADRLLKNAAESARFRWFNVDPGLQPGRLGDGDCQRQLAATSP